MEFWLKMFAVPPGGWNLKQNSLMPLAFANEICGSNAGEDTPEIFKKSRIFLDPSTGSGQGRVCNHEIYEILERFF